MGQQRLDALAQRLFAEGLDQERVRAGFSGVRAISRSIGSASLSNALSGDFRNRLVSIASGTETRFPNR